MYKTNYILLFLCGCLLWACRKETALGPYPYGSDKEPLKVKLSTETLRPSVSAPGNTITLYGSGFAQYKKEELLVRFNGEPGEVLSVSDTRLEVKVPVRASSGMITLTINKQVLAGPQQQISGPVAADAAFKSFPGASGGSVAGIRFQGDGKYVIVGSFTDYDNSGEADGLNGMARLNPDGSIDRSFRTRRGFFGGNVQDALPLPDGRYLVAGSFSRYRGRFDGRVQNMITLNQDGSPDTLLVHYTGLAQVDTVPAFALGFDAPVSALHRQTDGKIILAGDFRKVFRKTYGGVSADGKRDSVLVDTLHLNYLARLNADLTLDTTYNFDPALPAGKPSVNGRIEDSYLNSADQLMIAGSFTTFNGAQAVRIARLDTLGALDPAFNVGTGPDNTVSSIDHLPDGRVVAAGYFVNVAGKSLKRIALFTASGALDNNFNPGESTVGSLSHIRVLDNGKILVSGFFDQFQGYSRGGVAILEADGKLSTTYNNFSGFQGGLVTASAALTARNSIVLVGGFSSFDLKPVSGIVKLNY
ncbi:DUF5008 domain-containing protein [Niabella drilacis]|uniref:Delta-60 repeat domain-containing protein n=1 Tax=Niabella drilacis (strain DSM 25811 / CCM 8410 / CCUG 62505 / LMG 26954 / E90) TaxID=1285928 RepID=A0A1G6R9B6_NIADE|nr:DUF5008 domain-containing protein [Niabella drilacis]SDD01240.1 delta-60 repeat domain-containing protein [Niabella drilacis]